jgi:iron complex transport system substrate-binding protein
VREGELHEIKSPLILQPGPAALTDGLDAVHQVILRWAERHSATRVSLANEAPEIEGDLN